MLGCIHCICRSKSHSYGLGDFKFCVGVNTGM